MSELWSRSNPQREFGAWSSSDVADLSHTFGEPATMLSGIEEQRLPNFRVHRYPVKSIPVGLLLYLVSVGVIATAMTGVFFGTGLFLLKANEAPTAVLVVSTPAAEASPLASTTGVPALSDTRPAELLARGDALFRIGDIASARLFYERAAEAGDRQAAMRMATTFDPAALVRAGARNTLGDPAQASSWYDRALSLSASRAGYDTNGVETK